VCNLIARKECREEILKNELQPGKFDVCITTFEGIRICMGALQKFEWKYIIIDEAHKIKNEDS
jgi:SWI/SNF-related matrix-associated actin-dependent regulator of chromatin subfamily A member 5